MTWSPATHHEALISAGHRAIERSRQRDRKVRADRTVWMFWGGPMPEHLVACIGKAEGLRGALDLVVVRPETARAFAPSLPTGWEDLPTWAHRSDVLAPHLLAAHGGLYMDVDTVPVRSIERFVDRMAAGPHDFEVFRNQWAGPSVGVMWSRAGGTVARRYVELLDARLEASVDEMRWTELGTPVLREALEDCDRDPHDLAPMIGNVALFTFRASRTFALPSRDLHRYIAALTGPERRLEMVALFNSRSGDVIAHRDEPTLVDDLLELDLDVTEASAEPTNERTTFVIKTFNRPRTIDHTLSRLRQTFPSAPVVVVDDSDDDHIADLRRHEVAHVVLEFDSGLSRGRNMGVQLAATEYVLLHDDDQFPAADLVLDAVEDLLDRVPELDGVGGWEDETPHVRDRLEHQADGTLDQHRHTPWRQVDADDGPLALYHMVQNQVVWRRSVFEGPDAVRWTDQLKVGEHVDFFFRYRGSLHIALRDDLHFANVPTEVRWADQTETDYAQFRGRQGVMWWRFKTNQGVTGIRVIDRVDVDFAFRSRPWRALAGSVGSLLRRPNKRNGR